jgi:hypothetical protein
MNTKMINYLTNKIKYPNGIHQMRQGDYCIDHLINGTLLTCPGSAILFNDHGKIHRLSLAGKCSTTDWELHCRLYDLISNDANCRIEIPVARQTVTIDNELYDYFEVQRPGSELGTGFLDDVADKIVDTEYFLQYISQVNTMLRYLSKLSKQHNSGIPGELLAPYKRYQDRVGIFWVDFKNWNIPLETFIEKKIRTLYLSLLSFNDVDLNIPLIMSTAESQWNSI